MKVTDPESSMLPEKKIALLRSKTVAVLYLGMNVVGY